MNRREFVLSGATLLNSQSGSARATHLVPPETFLRHTAEREFIGPAVIQVREDELWMVAPWGRPPVDFRQVKRFSLPPGIYKSSDGGRTWQPGNRLNMSWDLPGIISDGGITFLRLRSGRLMATFHRNVYEYHGGGVPAISFSSDDGRSWSAAQTVQGHEEVFYVMNERTIQLRSGRLVIPVAQRPTQMHLKKYVEGNVCLSGCFLSDDEGKSWRLSATVSLDDERGMQEPAVAELSDGSMLMLARTGGGFHYASFSHDGGESWMEPKPTTLTAACSPLTLKRMPNGHLFLAYNHAKPLFKGSFFPRHPLCYSVSKDGRNWSTPVTVDDAPQQQLIYPSITFLKKGILLVYSAHRDPGNGHFGTPEDWGIGGGKRCIIPYPD